jgi:hypothetical protein
MAMMVTSQSFDINSSKDILQVPLMSIIKWVYSGIKKDFGKR